MPELQRLDVHHAAALLRFERENRAYFARSVPDRGDGYFTEFTARHAELLAEQAAPTPTPWLHFDLRPGDGSRDEELTRLTSLGATQVDDRRNPDGTGWVVLADPEGNEFCILRGDARGGLSQMDDSKP